MESKVLARIAAIVFVAVVFTAAVIGMIRKDDPVPAPAAARLQAPADPLREGQRRCQQMGEAAAEDAGCLRIWSDTRDRFLGRETNPAAPVVTEGR
ncbi:putative entry exclusion protein TrbK-alt [Methylobacterium aquaticum]|uniref:putative entry exclusion protein TrbK-alt n=1 Tax=Methylobacterium aquaticum TaxID=270351 RepID=UPI003D1843D0